MPTHQELANFIWQIADLLRGPYRPPQYERVMLPMTVLRRFDCVLAPTKEKVLAEHARRKGGKLGDDALDRLLNRAAGQRFHNHSQLTFEKLKGDPDHIDKHLTSYINGFSANVRHIFEYFEFLNEIEKMREANILYLVVSKFCDIDLHPDAVDNIEMGLLFENLIRRFNELANETAGDHFTPRDVIRLMVNLLFLHDDDLLSRSGTVRKLLDCACGTGGMLAEGQNYMRDHHAEARLFVYGQDYNKRAFAIAASDMLIKQVDHNGTGDNIRFGDSFTEDQFEGETFDYFDANVPFGVDWKKQQKEIVKLYGWQTDGETSKTFDNADFGYTRVTVERPLRLRYQMTLEDKARFLDACPHLLDDVQAIDLGVGREPKRDCNAVWSGIEDLLHARKSRWKATEQKLFRSVFTQKDHEAEAVGHRIIRNRRWNW